MTLSSSQIKQLVLIYVAVPVFAAIYFIVKSRQQKLKESGKYEQEQERKIYSRYIFYMNNVLLRKRFRHIVSTELNVNFLKDKPFMKMGDVTVVFYVCFREDEDGNIPISWITNKLKDSWSINLCDLYSTAIRNSMREDKAVLTSIQDAMFKMTVGAPYQCMNLLSDDVPLDPEDMYVLTNKSKNRGAAVILYEGVLSDVADRMCVDVLYIIPSSIHEVIVLGGLKCSEERVCTELEEMIRSINETEVLHEEILGNRPLIYRRKDDRICSMSEI